MPKITNAAVLVNTRSRGSCGVPQGQHAKPMLQPAVAAKPDIVDEVDEKLDECVRPDGYYSAERRRVCAEIVTLCRRDVSDEDLVGAVRTEMIAQEESHAEQLAAIRVLVERLQTERRSDTRDATCTEIFGLLESDMQAHSNNKLDEIRSLCKFRVNRPEITIDRIAAILES